MREIIEQLKPGDHAALFYRSRNEQFAAVIPYIQHGLRSNHRCLYIAGDNSLRMVINAMEAAGIDVSRHEKEGRLIVATPEQTYLRYGVFEPQKMVEELTIEIERALADGYSAFCGTGELGWAARLPSALLRLYEYEQSFDAALSNSFVALCQYNETIFPPELVSQMVRIHPKILARGKLVDNSYYLGPKVDVNSVAQISIEQAVGA